jgi:hypothetical protein
VDHQPGTNQIGREPTRLAFHASRIIIDVGVLIALGAMSLPFVEAPTGARDSISADALPALLLLVPIFLITLIPDHTRPVPGPLGWVPLVLGIAAFPYAIVKFVDAVTVADTVGGTVGLGSRLLVFGTFVTLLGIGVGLARRLLRLPSGGSYPKVRPPTRPVEAPQQQRQSPPQRQQPQRPEQQPQRPEQQPHPEPRSPSPRPNPGAPQIDRTRDAPPRHPGSQSRPDPGPGTRPPGREH